MTARPILPSSAHGFLLSGSWLLAFELGRPWPSGWLAGAAIATVVAVALFIALRARYGARTLPLVTTISSVAGAVALTYLFRAYPLVNRIVIALLVVLIVWAMLRQRSGSPAPPPTTNIH